MSSFEERDTILRAAKRLGEVLGRAVQQLLGKRPDDARATLEAGCVSVFGIELSQLVFMEATSAAELLGHPSRIVAFAKLLEVLADVAAAQGEVARERSYAQQALEVALEALRRRRDEPEALALMKKVLPRVDRSLVPNVYRETLDALLPG